MVVTQLVTVVTQLDDSCSSVLVTVVAQWSKAPCIHSCVAGLIPAVTPRYCTIETMNALWGTKKKRQGEAEQDCHDRNSRAGRPGQGCQHRTARIRQPGQNRKERAPRKGQPEQDS